MATAERLLIVASGSSCNAARTIRGWVEQACGLPCDVEDASEWRDRCSPLARGTVGVLVSRSGDTEDVLAALDIMRARAVPTVAVVNAPRSPLARGVDLRWPTEAGPELAVAATKSFTAQLLALARLGLAFAVARGTLDAAGVRQAERSLAEAPLACALAEAADARLAAIALQIARAGEVMVIGRGWGAALAEEAALKLKQLAHVHADALPAGALRHGPLAMVRAGVPVLVLASADQHLARTAANAEQVRAHGGHVIALAEASCSASSGPCRARGGGAARAWAGADVRAGGGGAADRLSHGARARARHRPAAQPRGGIGARRPRSRRSFGWTSATRAGSACRDMFRPSFRHLAGAMRHPGPRPAGHAVGTQP